jgi:plasmid replication initiation protein
MLERRCLGRQYSCRDLGQLSHPLQRLQVQRVRTRDGNRCSTGAETPTHTITGITTGNVFTTVLISYNRFQTPTVTSESDRSRWTAEAHLTESILL